MGNKNLFIFNRAKKNFSYSRGFIRGGKKNLFNSRGFIRGGQQKPIHIHEGLIRGGQLKPIHIQKGFIRGGQQNNLFKFNWLNQRWAKKPINIQEV